MYTRSDEGRIDRAYSTVDKAKIAIASNNDNVSDAIEGSCSQSILEMLELRTVLWTIATGEKTHTAFMARCWLGSVCPCTLSWLEDR